MRCLDAPGWQEIVSGDLGSSSIHGQHEPLHHGDIMSEHLRRAPNPRATPTMQASHRLTFKFWSMLTGRCKAPARRVILAPTVCRAKQRLLQLCRQVHLLSSLFVFELTLHQPVLCKDRSAEWPSEYSRACLIDFKSILADAQVTAVHGAASSSAQIVFSCS
jgi:hypothetical protein